MGPPTTPRTSKKKAQQKRRPARGRHAMHRSAEDIHRIFGITDPRLMRALSYAAIGVNSIDVDLQRNYASTVFLEAASRRCPVSGERLIQSILSDVDFPMGSAWAGDPTPKMVKSLDGNHFAFIFLELRSGLLHPIPLKEKTAKTCIEAFAALEGFVRRRFPNTTLRQLHLDSDPVFTKTNPNSSLTGPRNVHELDMWLRDHQYLTIKHSPPHTQALNPF